MQELRNRACLQETASGMEKRSRVPMLVLVMLAGLISSGSSIPGPASEREGLNVLLISIDTIRPDRLSCYGSKYVQTPRIDSLAAKGVVFERAFAHNPITLPSHANMLLGITPPSHGVHDNSKFRVKEDFLTLAEYLKGRGYSTGAFIGAFPLDSRFGLDQGFDVYDESYPSRLGTMLSFPERDAGQVVQAARSWLERQGSRWFLFIHIWDPHVPYHPPAPFSETYRDDLYSGEVAYVDSELGKLFDDLESKGLAKNTLVLLTGDHGEALGEHGELTHGYFAYGSTLWVPLIIAGPGIDPGRSAEEVCHIDIFPTVCDVLGTGKPPFLQGVSLRPLMTRKKAKKRAIYFESLDPFYNMGCAPLRGFIEGRKKYFDSPLPELYDLENDFNEERNLVQEIDLESYRKRLKDLIQDLSSAREGKTAPKVDRETQEKLRSLGYVASFAPQIKESYGPEDDLKTFLPVHEKLNRAIMARDGGKVEESIQLLGDIIEKKKGFAAAYLILRHIYRDQGDLDQALAVLEEGYKNNPKNYDIISAYGMLLIEKEELDKGIAVLQTGVALLDYDPEIFNYLGLGYWKKGDEKRALEHYQKALELDNNFALAYSNLGALYHSIFLRTKNRGDLVQAMDYFKKAIECDPKLAIAYRGLGICYRIAGRADAAISVWEKALELSPGDGFIVLRIGLAHLDMGNKDRALEHFEKYLALAGDSISPEERRQVEDYIRKCKQIRP
jgi:arylsulfatase A-like enzyme/Tfp pilus assembly protein PilF